MIDIDALFPDLAPTNRQALETAPRTLGAMSAHVDYKEYLPLNDPRYVPTTKARGENFEQDFYRTFGYEPADGTFTQQGASKHVLFFGHVGCGKSTELTQMAAALHHPDRYWVVSVRLLDLIDPNDARYSDVWLAVAQELIAKLQADQVPVDKTVLSRLERWFSERVLSNDQVKEFAADIKTEAEAGTGIPFIGKLLARFTSTIRTGSTHRESLRTVVRNTYGEFADALNQLIIDVGDRVRALKKGRDILFVIDGTDRFSGDDWKRLFVDDANQLTLVKCVAVYTAPMALKARNPRFDLYESLVLPMVKLRDYPDQDKRREPACRTLRDVVLRRCHHSLFDRVETLDALIDYAGGHLRDMLRLLAFAGSAAPQPLVDRPAVDEAARRLASDYRDWLKVEDYPALVAAARDPENVGTDNTIERLIEGAALLQYNRGSWQVPHPVVKLLPGYRRAETAARPAPAP